MTETLIGPDRLLDVLGAEGELLASSATGAQPDLDVPGCPGLTLGETVSHVGSSYRMLLSWLRSGDRPTEWRRGPEPGQPAEDYLRAGLAELVAELAAHDPAEPCPTWWPAQQNYGFWRRRMAHETTVHRVDVQGAAGEPVDVIADDVALDGVDEILSLWFTHRLAVLGVSGTRYGQVTVLTGGRAWVARVTPSGTSVRRAVPEDVAGSVAGGVAGASVTADPMPMYLWLWGRRSIQAVREAGDHDEVAQLWALLRIATR